ncbi:uncharacterized protein LOC114454459 [Gouania willdenowi]|uniref:OTU domain-containing protein n=1 Tax=Gouania willdenowi TaxID=441366 RepID=A0A8C5H5A8_GOUWI|nr:ubiquitin thioesterase otulin [Gouania willdenowi]XP_028290752.1 ubiquitin thioesterase otulin [Gouania willdenowi]
MGNSCCPAESPCGSVEERSVLLKDDSKPAACTGDTVGVGTCGPGGDDDLRKTPDEAVEATMKVPSYDNIETELKNTQENRPTQTESLQTATSCPHNISPRTGNGARAQDKDTLTNAAADSSPAQQLQCTPNSLQNGKPTTEWEVFPPSNAEEKEGKASPNEDRPADDVSHTEQKACVKKASHTETNTGEQIGEITNPHDEDDEEEAAAAAAASRVAGDEAVCESEDMSTHNEEISVLNSAPSAPLGQLLPISMISQLPNPQPLSCAATDGSETNASSEFREELQKQQSHNVAKASSEPEPEGLDCSEDEQNSYSPVTEPESTTPAQACESFKPDLKPDPECLTMSLTEVSEEEMMLEEMDKAEDVTKAKDDHEINVELETQVGRVPSDEVEACVGEEGEVQELTITVEESETTAEVEVEESVIASVSAAQKDNGHQDSEEDLYRGAEELNASEQITLPDMGTQLLKVEERCSLSTAVGILTYSEREWKGNTAKSALIKKGYKEMSHRFSSLRRVRGDNYCALRATLFQVLSHSTQLPTWLQDDDITSLPKHLQAQEGLISQWTFPSDCLLEDRGDATQRLGGYMELLQNKWRAAVDCSSAAERQQLCERLFQCGEEELGLLEAVKLLMLGRAVELYGCMQAGGDVPLFCWLLFARDSSDCPRSFLSNHLSRVGLSAGMEQVEMFLLGYALHCTIQVYRLYKADTEEFVTYYPDDHIDEWQSVCLITEDDRHYNVPVVEAAEFHKELSSS